MQETLAVLHVIGATALLGGGLIVLFVGPRLGAAGGETALNWARTAGALARRFFIPAAVLTLLTGVFLVVNGDEWGWDDLFVNIGLAVIVINMVLAIGIQGPTGRRIVAAIETGDLETAGANARKAALIGLTTTTLVLVAVVVMVLKVGAT